MVVGMGLFLPEIWNDALLFTLESRGRRAG